MTPKTLMISIITPSFNRCAFLGRVYDSLFQQTYHNWEWILVDDGSTDDTRAWASGIDDCRLHYVFQENQGEGAARNTGVKYARGKYILFLDSDDWLYPNALESHLKIHDGTLDMSIGDGHYVDATGCVICRLSDRRRINNDISLCENVIRDAAVVGAIHAVMFRKIFVDQSGIRFDTDISIGPDWLFLVRLLCSARVEMVPELTCAYRWHKGNVSLSAQRKEILFIAHQHLLQYEFFPELTSETREIVLSRILFDLLDGKTDRQYNLLGSGEFQRLPESTKARLMRILATNWLSSGVETAWAKELLARSNQIQPANIKTVFSICLSYLPTTLQRRLFLFWKKQNKKPVVDPILSLLEMGK